jgi:hypothetical protein
MFDCPGDIDNVVLQSRYIDRYREGYSAGLDAARREMRNILQMTGIVESRCLDADVIQRVRDGMWGSLMIVSCRQWHELKQEVQELRRALSAYAPRTEDDPEE